MFILFYVTKTGYHFIDDEGGSRDRIEKEVKRMKEDGHEVYIVDTNELLEELRQKHQSKPEANMPSDFRRADIFLEKKIEPRRTSGSET